MSHVHAHEPAPAPRPSMERLAGELRFQVVGRLEPAAAPKPRAKRVARFPWISAVLLALIALGCVFADVLAPGDPNYMDLLHCRVAPCGAFPFGTDASGRDLFAMIWHGGRISLGVGLLATAVSTAVAVVYGAVSGAAPDWLDGLMMRFLEILLSVPSLLAVIFLQAALGANDPWTLSLVLGATGWMAVARVVRTEVRRLRRSEYVAVARSTGGGFFHILWNHLLPNFLPSILFMVVMNVRGAIVAESTLSFMGLGLPLDTVSWGSMLSLSEKALLTGDWWIILIPGAFLVATLMCVTELGEALRARLGRAD